MKWKITFTNFQVVNGGQTLRTLYAFKNKTTNEETLHKANILVRIFMTGTEKNLTNKIAEYTNSQNAISAVDLKSLNPMQMKIEQILKDKNILYVRKVGDTGESGTEYEHRISMERFGQLLFSKQGQPHRASNQKKKIFDKYYDQIFGNYNIEESVSLVEKYLEIIKFYEESSFQANEQKIYYALYLNEKNTNIDENVRLIEKVLSEYRKEDNISEVRKLIQKGFKDELDKQAKLIQPR